MADSEHGDAHDEGSDDPSLSARGPSAGAVGAMSSAAIAAAVSGTAGAMTLSPAAERSHLLDIAALSHLRLADSAGQKVPHAAALRIDFGDLLPATTGRMVLDAAISHTAHIDKMRDTAALHIGNLMPAAAGRMVLDAAISHTAHIDKMRDAAALRIDFRGQLPGVKIASVLDAAAIYVKQQQQQDTRELTARAFGDLMPGSKVLAQFGDMMPGSKSLAQFGGQMPDLMRDTQTLGGLATLGGTAHPLFADAAIMGRDFPGLAILRDGTLAGVSGAVLAGFDAMQFATGSAGRFDSPSIRDLLAPATRPGSTGPTSVRQPAELSDVEVLHAASERLGVSWSWDDPVVRYVVVVSLVAVMAKGFEESLVHPEATAAVLGGGIAFTGYGIYLFHRLEWLFRHFGR
jgi:hypothetical protein